MKTLHVVGAAIVDGEQVLACRRASHKSLAGFYEFPGGKKEDGEGDKEALRREIHEELGTDIVVKDFVGRGASCVAGFSIQLDCYLCEMKAGRPTTSSDHDQLRWVTKDELEDLQWAEADVPIVTQLKRYLQSLDD